MEQEIKGKFPAERHNVKASFPSPRSGELLYETPPTFIWNKVGDGVDYTLTVWNENGEQILKQVQRETYFTPKEPLAPGKYSWNVESGDLSRGVECFEISDDALFFDRPTAREVWDSVPSERPRHLFCASDIKELVREHPEALKTLDNNLNLAYSHGFPEPPRFHEDEGAVPYRKYFGELRDFCDRDLIATSLKYALTADARAGEHARQLLLTLCNNMLEDERYLTAGALDAATGDEVGLSMARCLPSAYDLLYPLLSESERAIVEKTVYIYGNACRERLKLVDYVNNPANSHAGRLPAYLGEAAVVLKGCDGVDERELISWLEEALDIYCGIFPYYGGSDGSWAEGAFYASSYTKWYLPFFSLVERYTGKSLMQRPFYHRFTDFLIHFVHPRYEIHPFGDGYWCDCDSAEWPGFFAQNPFRVYADRFGPEYARELSRTLDTQKYYSLHLLDLFLPDKKQEKTLAREPQNCAFFDCGGFIALHSDIYDEDGITLLARASRFGSDSHRHADQGSFALFSGGTALISPSGYFGFKFGTPHHVEWTNSTKAHNTLLIDGKGQPTNSMYSRAIVTQFDAVRKSVTVDLSDAYENARCVMRRIELTDCGAKIIDTVEADSPVEITLPLHTLSKPHLRADGLVEVERDGKRLVINPSLADEIHLDRISDEFDTPLNAGVAPENHVTMPEQYHVYYKSERKTKHSICFELTIQK